MRIANAPCPPDCHCPKCDDEMALVLNMDTESYSSWLKQRSLTAAAHIAGLVAYIREYGRLRVSSTERPDPTPSLVDRCRERVQREDAARADKRHPNVNAERDERTQRLISEGKARIQDVG